MKKNNKVLGKGLNALIGINETVIDNKQEAELDINKIVPNEKQPRKNFKDIEKLADSIKEHGIIQPVVVVSVGKDKYQIIAGERRWRAAKLAKLDKIPVIIKNFVSNQDTLVKSLIENIQRFDLNPIEQAESFQDLIEKHNMSLDYLSKVFGRERSTITNIIRLLNLPSLIKDDLRKGIIQEGHARPLISIEDKKFVLEVRNKIIKDKMSVRDVEKLIKYYNSKKKADQQPKKRKNIHIDEVVEKLQKKFATKVNINGSDKKGRIIIEYYSSVDLERFLEILNIK